jgi:hypothetical protein
MGIEAQAASFDPPTVPALWVEKEVEQDNTLQGAGEFDPLRIMAQTRRTRAQRDQWLLRLNIKNPLMQALREMHRNDTFHLALRVIYYNAAMQSRQFVPPGELDAMVTANLQACEAMVTNAREVEELRGQVARMEIEIEEMKRKAQVSF